MENVMKLRMFIAAALATIVAASLGSALTSLPAHAAQGTRDTRGAQGVTAQKITLGTILDLSGSIAAYGKQLRMGMQLRVDEVNEQGGIHGRKLELLVEDSSFDPKKAVLAAHKLVDRGGIFALVGHIGTPHNIATMPVLFEKNVVNFFPISAAREMHEPFHRLKFAAWADYLDQIGGPLPGLVKDRAAKKVCAIHQDDEFGLEIVRGAEAGLKTIGMTLAEKTSYKRGATDFSSQIARLKAAGCDLVVMGTIIRETVGAIAEARKTGFAPTFFASYAAYSELIPKLGGPAMDGLVVSMMLAFPYLDDATPNVRFWANKYKTKFGEDPTALSAYGYTVVDAFVRAAHKAGPRLDTDAFVKAMESITIAPDLFGGPELSFAPTKRLGSDATRLSQLIDGKWRVMSDYR
jgi:branched-chain amino acid transport system substrate-binding protein